MLKRLVVCCDGTWNTPDETDQGVPAPTNVTKVALCVASRDGAGTEDEGRERVTRDPDYRPQNLEYLVRGGETAQV